VRRTRQTGFVLIVLAVSILALAGVAGLAIDVGHLYVVKEEAQTLADLSSLAAVQELDGSPGGLDRARQRVREYAATRWKLRPLASDAVRVEFSASRRQWEEQPRTADGLRFVRVSVALDDVELFFLPAVLPRRAGRVRAAAEAGQAPVSDAERAGLLPFAILAHDRSPPDFGYRAGDEVTLRWPPSGRGPVTPCAADRQSRWVDAAVAAFPLGAGYIQDPAREAMQEAIEDGRVFQPLRLGEPVRMTGGEISLQAESLARRARQDTNLRARSWKEYSRSPGNGRRLGVVAVADPAQQVRLVGFGLVFLPVDPPRDNSQPLCAEWIGPAGRSFLLPVARLMQ
jgi:hypothetical protein